MDNAKIHNIKEVTEWCTKHDVPITWNVTYRPDLMGIEFFWRCAKNNYRQELTGLYVKGHQIDNYRLAERCCMSVTDDKAKKWALVGW